MKRLEKIITIMMGCLYASVSVATTNTIICFLSSFQQLLNNISIVWRIVSLPVLEPLTVKRLEKIITIMIGCLYASVSVATTNTFICFLSSFQQLLSNISIVWRIVSLPVLEPLTVKRLEKIITIMMGCLFASVSVATTNTIISLASGTPTKGTSSGKEEDTDSYAANIVQKTVSYPTC